MRSIGRDPIFVARGEGAELVDVDGNRYVDWVMSWGPLIAGHAHPEVVAAVTAAAAARARASARPTEAEVELAAEVVERVPSRRDGADDLVGHRGVDERAAAGAGGHRPRQDRSSSPAPTTATWTGCWPTPAPGLATQGIPASPGRDRGAGGGHGRRAVERPSRPSGRGGGASICEPYPANMGLVPAGATASSPRCASTRTETGALLVFDEVISGFRVGRGGAQEREGVTPDLTVLGKVHRRRACRPPRTPAGAT